jgi:hypothetical protein
VEWGWWGWLAGLTVAEGEFVEGRVHGGAGLEDLHAAGWWVCVSCGAGFTDKGPYYFVRSRGCAGRYVSNMRMLDCL